MSSSRGAERGSSVERVRESLNRFATSGRFSDLNEAGYEAMDSAKNVAGNAAWYWAKFAAKASIRLVAMIMVAAVVFAFLYWWTVPVAHVDFPLHFQFRSPEEPVTASALILNDPRYVDEVPTPVLTRGAAYDIDILFSMPESGVNKELGMFLASVVLQTSNGTALATSSRSSMLRYRSTPVTLLRTVFYWVPYVFDFWAEEQVVEVNFFKGYVDHGVPEPATRLFVSLNRPDMHLYAARARIRAEMNFFQSMASRWFYSTAVVFIFLISALEVVVVLAIAGLLFAKAFFTAPERTRAPNPSREQSLYDRHVRGRARESPRRYSGGLRRSLSDSSDLSELTQERLRHMGDVDAHVVAGTSTSTRTDTTDSGLRQRSTRSPAGAGE